MSNLLRSVKNILGCCCVIWLLWPVTARANYSSSAHGNGTTGVSGRLSGYDTGSCGHCHESHASVGGSEPSPTGGPDQYLGFEAEEALCFDCHDGTPADDIQDVIASTGSKTYRHQVDSYDNKHRADETESDIDTLAKQHVECTDCHNPHEAQSSNHSEGTNAVTSSSPLYKVKGAAPTWVASNWGGVQSWSYGEISYEYELCFKCHAGFNDNFASWGGSGAGAWSDVALEFNPNNKSYHPIVDTLNNGNSSSLASAQLTNGWTPGELMYCSDCHNADSGAQGPHGSDVKWMLAGSNTAWPYNNASYNGTSSGGTFWDLTDSPFSGLFCLNCHPSPTSSNSNEVHRKGNHQSSTRGKCVNCHLRVPHGGKVSRLIITSGASLPDRYYPDGNGGGSVYMQEYKKASDKDSYSKSNCQASCAGDHGSGVSSPESW